MKILFFYTYNKSYLSDFFIDICSELAYLGHDVKIISLKKYDSIFVLNSKVTVNIIKKQKRYQNYFILFNIIKNEKPDVVVSNFSYVNPVVLACKLLGVKHNVIWFHTLKSQMNFKMYLAVIKSKFMDIASLVITNSKELKQEVIKEYGQKPQKVCNLPFTTTVSNTDKKNISLNKEIGKIYIGCPGRLHPDKNQDFLIDALLELNNTNFVLVLVGSKQSNFLIEHKNFHIFKNQIVHLGNLSREEMVDFYSKMDLIVLPSLNESFGLVFIEALASGCNTLVSSRFGALDYIKEDISEMVFNPKNLNELKTKIKEALLKEKNSQYFKDLYKDNFSMEEVVKQFILLIEEKK